MERYVNSINKINYSGCADDSIHFRDDDTKEILKLI
jgi:hypothetical protein